MLTAPREQVRRVEADARQAGVAILDRKPPKKESAIPGGGMDF
ncbi:hypothetical protein ACNHKD_03135 [Methylocystis sp. JAN1]